MDLPYSDERTPLLQPRIPPLLPFTNSPTPSSSSKHSPQSNHHHQRPSSPSHAHSDQATLSISRLTHILAALKQGHLPTNRQTLDLLNYFTSSPLLGGTDDGSIWEPRYGRGRIGVGRLSREGENVRRNTREWLESLKRLIEQRIVRADGRDVWQEFIWSMRNHSVEIGKFNFRRSFSQRRRENSFFRKLSH